MQHEPLAPTCSACRRPAGTCFPGPCQAHQERRRAEIDADGRISAWNARHAAALAAAGQAAGFDPAEDRAALIARFFAAIGDRYSPDRDDPVLKPLIDRAVDRYGELRRHDFTFASKVANIEAVRAILAMKVPPDA